MITQLAMRWLSYQMHKYPDYAWSWHCNIAMVAKDAYSDGRPIHEAANSRAADFMWNAFGVDTRGQWLDMDRSGKGIK